MRGCCAARDEMHPGLYLRFLNNLVNDSIYLLDEAMKALPEIKDKEAVAASPEWANMPFRQQQDHMCAPHVYNPGVLLQVVYVGDLHIPAWAHATCQKGLHHRSVSYKLC